MSKGENSDLVFRNASRANRLKRFLSQEFPYRPEAVIPSLDIPLMECLKSMQIHFPTKRLLPDLRAVKSLFLRKRQALGKEKTGIIQRVRGVLYGVCD